MRVSAARPLLLILIPLALLAVLAVPVWAESYSVSAIPGYSQEVASDTTLQLIVNNTSTSTLYTFTWRVTDPTGTTTTVSRSTNSLSSTSIVQTVLFPTDFVGANTNYVGIYAVRVDQTAPRSVTNVASTQFEIGLASSKVVTRTVPVSIRARGYTNGENVTVDVQNNGISVPGFPTYVTATALGTVIYQWTPSLSTPLGTDTIRVRGSSTFKFPTDTQRVTVVPANITVSGLTVTPGTVQRTLSFQIQFSASYFSGGPVQSGGAAVRVVEADGLTTHFVMVGYNSTLDMFTGTYRVGLGATTGIWTVNMDPNIVDDGNGNVGPSSPTSVQLTVQAATLAVSVSPFSQSYDSGNGIGIFATITSPDGSVISSGTVTATLSNNGTRIASVGLTYVPAQGYWTGLYTIGQRDPSGQWLVSVNATDPYGNHGQASARTNVKVVLATPTASLFTLSLYLFLVGVAAFGSLAGVVYVTRFRDGSKPGLPFETLFQLTGGEIPTKSLVLILASKDQDATALGLQLANRYLAKGYYCGLLAYGLAPADLSGRARKYGWKPAPYIEKGTLEALDCFSPVSIGGSIKNPLDFGEVGASVGAMLEKAAGVGPAVIVLDSLTNTFKTNPPRKVVGFVSLLTEKVKGENGTLFLAVEKSVLSNEDLTAMEGLADGVIELGGEGRTRTLQVQKTFGRQVKPLPVEYTIKTGRGFQFRQILSSVIVRSEQGARMIESMSKHGVSYMREKSVHGAAAARAMSTRTMSMMRTQSQQKISPVVLTVSRTLRGTIRLRISTVLRRKLPAAVRLRLSTGVRRRVPILVRVRTILARKEQSQD